MILIRDRLPITKGDPSRKASPAAAAPGPSFFFGENFVARRPSTESFSTETPYKITFFVQAKFVSLPMAPVDYKDRHSKAGPFVQRLRRSTRESHTSLPQFLLNVSPFPSLSLCTHPPFHGLELIGDGRARLEIKNRVARRALGRDQLASRIGHAEPPRTGNPKLPLAFFPCHGSLRSLSISDGISYFRGGRYILFEA